MQLVRWGGAACAILGTLSWFAACGGNVQSSGPGVDAGNQDQWATGAEAGEPVDTGTPDPPNASTPPPQPAGPAATLGSPRTFAMQTIFLGSTDRSGAPSATAWKAYGYDIDHKVTTSKSTDVCTLQAGAPKSSQSDGNGGIDNSFGENILPILTSVSPTVEKDENDGVRSGAFTLLFVVDGLTDDPAQTSTGLKVQVFLGATFPGKPTFTMADDWPVDSSSLTDNATLASGSTYQSTDAYVANGQLVVRLDHLDVPLSFASSGSALPLRDVVLTFAHDKASTLDLGVVSAVLDTEVYISRLHTAAGRIQPSLCAGAAFDQIAQEIRQAEDLLLDGTNSSGVQCTGISVGLGLTAAQIGALDKVASPTPPGPDPCAADQ